MSDAVLRAFIVIAAVVIIFLSYGVMVDAQTTRDAFDECMISEHKVKEVFDNMNLRVYFDDNSYKDLKDVTGIVEYPIEPVYHPYYSTGHLTKDSGVFMGPSGKETWYNRPMGQCIDMMADQGFSLDDYHVREDGVKMISDYIMCAADTNRYPKGTPIQTSLGRAIVVDHCEAGNIDICTTW